PSDMGAGGGSSGSGGYGNAEDVQNQHGQSGRQAPAPDPHQSRGERFDERAGGGRGPDSVSFDRARDGAGEIAEDQRAHQDRGQSEAEAEG
ncbi:MAG: hypothetical protein M3N07_09460, partial [Pseudomonadota bacterium]|nr:hypothetical protein [Pseudomonadota bacterium]